MEVDVLILRKEGISTQAAGINVFGVVQRTQEIDAYITPRGIMKNRFAKGPST